MPPHPVPFLTAEWRQLLFLNFAVEPPILARWLPRGTELDTWQGTTLVSLVGFLFQRTRMRGLPIPWHGSFEEVNLRFYVRRQADDGWRRGVSFIKELAPRRAIVLAARWLYGENYLRVPMGHDNHWPAGDDSRRALSYRWNFGGSSYQLEGNASGVGQKPAAGTQEEFIAEHYWGYSGGADRPTIEYRVEHPQWRLWSAGQAHFRGDVARLYGAEFVDALSAPPVSAYLADGSEVGVYRGSRI